MRLPAEHSAATISRSERTLLPPGSSRAATVAVTQEWMRLAGEGRGVGSSWRQAARRPARVQTTIRPLLPIPGRTSISSASRSRCSLAAVTARAVAAHIATASLGTTPKRAMNSSTSRSLWLILPVLLAPGICFRDVPRARSDTPQPLRLPSVCARRRSRPRTHHMVCVRGRLRPKGSNPLGRRSGCGRCIWRFVWGGVCSPTGTSGTNAAGPDGMIAAS